MPNGMPDLDIRTFESFISPVEKRIEHLIARRGLALQKYYHDAPSWDLCFSHSAGGLAKIEISMLADRNAKIHGIWWLDDRDNGTRSIRRSSDRTISTNASEFVEELELLLDEILRWCVGEWDSVHSGYQEIWSTDPEKNLESASSLWPIPTIVTD